MPQTAIHHSSKNVRLRKKWSFSSILFHPLKIFRPKQER